MSDWDDRQYSAHPSDWVTLAYLAGWVGLTLLCAWVASW